MTLPLPLSPSPNPNPNQVHPRALEGGRALEEGPVNVPVGGAGGQLRYHRRSGVHDVTRYDWEQYLTFAEEHFGMAAAAGATTAAAQGRSRL